MIFVLFIRLVKFVESSTEFSSVCGIGLDFGIGPL